MDKTSQTPHDHDGLWLLGQRPNNRMKPNLLVVSLAYFLTSDAFQSTPPESRPFQDSCPLKAAHRDQLEPERLRDHHVSTDPSPIGKCARRTVIKNLPLLLAASLGLKTDRAWAEESAGPGGDLIEKQALPTTIGPCQRSSDPSVAATTNCVSTASVRQLDLYMPPWTFNGMTKQEVVARLKGAIASDPTLTLLVDQPNYLKAQASRNFCTDELEFAVNEADQVVTFRSSQVGGPAVSDFNANRRRLDDIRAKARLGVMGQEYELADPSSEGPLGQLKAFYGLQSGEGFEDVNLE